jgi:hypothetical protein
MGRRKRDGNNSAPQNKLVQDSEGNEETVLQIQTPTKKRKTIPRNPMKTIRTH